MDASSESKILGVPTTARSMTSYIDTHCHLDRYDDPASILDECPNTVVVAVSEVPSDYRLLEARFRNDKRVRLALGLHPLRAADAGPLEEGHLIRYLTKVRYVGEIGLDFSQHGRASKSSQLRVLERLLSEPILRNRVVTAHSRGAEKVLITMLADAGVPAILHWYTGPIGLVDTALAAGMYFSVNSAMLMTDKGKSLLKQLPRDRVLTESDGPYSKPRGSSGPSQMPALAEGLGRHWLSTRDDVVNTVHQNMSDLYATTVGKLHTAAPQNPIATTM